MCATLQERNVLELDYVNKDDESVGGKNRFSVENSGCLYVGFLLSPTFSILPVNYRRFLFVYFP